MFIRIGIFLVALLLTYLLIRRFIHNKDISYKNILSTLIILIYLILLHNFHMQNEAQRVQKLIIAFKKGDTILCKNIDSDNKDVNVTQKDYNFESGTLVFINKKIPEIRFGIDDCRIIE